MYKQIIISMAMLSVQSVMADANIDKSQPQSTILLQAPGTLSAGSTDSSGNAAGELKPAPESRYRYPEDVYQYQRRNIPQFGQEFSRNNPWIENQYGQPLPSPTVPRFAPHPGYNNPWHVGGPQPSEQFSREPYPMNIPGPMNAPNLPQFGLNDPLNNVYPDYTDGIYRDTNPAARYPYYPGYNRGGGLVNDMPFSNFNMPFSPFGMF